MKLLLPTQFSKSLNSLLTNTHSLFTGVLVLCWCCRKCCKTNQSHNIIITKDFFFYIFNLWHL